MKAWWNKYKYDLAQVGIFVAILGFLVSIGIFIVVSSRNDENIGQTYDPPTAQYALIDLGSTSCDPCVRLQPELATLREKHGDRIDIRFFDIINTQEGASWLGC